MQYDNDGTTKQVGYSNTITDIQTEIWLQSTGPKKLCQFLDTSDAYQLLPKLIFGAYGQPAVTPEN